MQLTVNRETVRPKRNGLLEASTLVELAVGEQAVIEKIELPEEFARRLMELGFLPGHVVTAVRGAPGGDPQVFRVDGSEVALRRETAACLHISAADSPTLAE